MQKNTCFSEMSPDL